MQPQQFKIEDFSYDLPENRIAKYPLAERASSRLLVFKNGDISEDSYRNIDQYIPENALLVFNDTKVVHARILFQNANGGKIEVFCLEPAEENATPDVAMAQTERVRWKCLVGRLAKWKEKTLVHQSPGLQFSAEMVQRGETAHTIEFSWQPETLSFAELLETIGQMPIPPYLKRESEAIDSSRYQTVYARQKGSVAAPTAGLHFTEGIFERLQAKGISKEYVTLHVGAGTFKPVKSETLEGHEMHAEWIDVSAETIGHILQQLQAAGKMTIAVGTTSLRTLETLYWMGAKAHAKPGAGIQELEIRQWDPYSETPALPPTTALQSLLSWMEQHKTPRLICKTQIIIVPSYQLKIADALVTNFHQPNSTLLLLVAAVTGNRWRDIYQYALDKDFRFLSYGDGSLLFRAEDNKA
jgi:S-adenosylmethionine:tRNA ribosyltransferase-isomerase